MVLSVRGVRGCAGFAAQRGVGADDAARVRPRGAEHLHPEHGQHGDNFEQPRRGGRRRQCEQRCEQWQQAEGGEEEARLPVLWAWETFFGAVSCIGVVSCIMVRAAAYSRRRNA